MAVILFHAGVHGFDGGFLGVDIFFVISGFLITEIIKKDIQKQQFSFLEFYERRARRIFPALFIVLAATIPLAWLFLPALDFKEYGESLGATSAFLSNHLFLNKSSYFDTASELRPLLHTWSLSVEEQFYIFFPWLLLLSRNRSRQTAPIITAGVAIISLLFAQAALQIEKPIGFFSLPSRAWELMIGALAAQLSSQSGIRTIHNRYAQTMSAIGLILVLFSITQYDKSVPSPSIHTLPPTIGAALLLVYASPDTIAGRILSLRPLVAIGLISYSAYLIHQPVFVFARHGFLEYPHHTQTLALIIATLGLSYISWRFVETPWRKNNHLTQARTFIYSIVFLVVFLLAGFYIKQKNGFPDRFHLPDTISNQITEKPPASLCAADPSRGIIYSECKFGAYESGKDSKIALFGDSHSEVINFVFDALAKERGVYYTHMGLGGCPPLIGVDVHRGNHAIGICSQLSKDQYAFAQRNKIKKVVLVARWSLYTHGDYTENSMHGYFLTFSYKKYNTQENSRAVFISQLDETIKQYENLGIKVYILIQVPQQKLHSLRFYQKFSRFHNTDANTIQSEIDKRSVDFESHLSFGNFYRGIMEKYANNPFVKILNPDGIFCNSQSCSWGTPEYSFYKDEDHLTRVGAMRLAPLVKEIWEK